MMKILLVSFLLINIILTLPKNPSYIAVELKKLKETTGFLRLFSDEKFNKNSISKGCFDIPLNVETIDNFPGHEIFYKLMISAYFYDLTTEEYFFKNKENALNVLLDEVEGTYGEKSIITSVTNQESYEEYKASTYANRCKLTRAQINDIVRSVLGKTCSVPDGFEKKMGNFDKICSEKLKKVFEMISLQSKEYASNKRTMYGHARKAIDMLFLSIVRNIIDGKDYQELKLRYLLIAEYLIKIGMSFSSNDKDGLREARGDFSKYNDNILETDLSLMSKETVKDYKNKLLEIHRYSRIKAHIEARKNMIETLIGRFYTSEKNRVI